MKQQAAWLFIQQNLLQQVPVMLLYVINSKGSSPGRQGFMMAVNARGEMVGSIGGGIMEHKLAGLARQRLQQAGRQKPANQVLPEIKRQVHDKSAVKDQSGMICSGEQIILLYPAKESDSLMIAAILASLQANLNGTLQLSPEGIVFTADIAAQDFTFDYVSDKEWIYKEKTGYKNRLSIIGGGHCSRALSGLMRTMDFYLELVCDREHFDGREENPFVHRQIRLEDYGQLAGILQPVSNHYAVVMTVGYRTDYLALKQLLGLPFTYIGVLGSKNKIRKLLSQLREEGIDISVDCLHAPIGISINSQTPEEIAVSIAAEIISIKNGGDRYGDNSLPALNF